MSLIMFVGKYIVMQDRLPNYIVPDLSDFKV